MNKTIFFAGLSSFCVTVKHLLKKRESLYDFDEFRFKFRMYFLGFLNIFFYFALVSSNDMKYSDFIWLWICCLTSGKG